MSASQARVWRSLGKGRIPEKKRMGQGRNVCGLKGGWLKKASSPVIHRPAKPCGKQDATHETFFAGFRWQKRRKPGKEAVFWVALQKGKGIKGERGMDTEKIKFSIRMDEELVRTADAYVQEGMALSRTEMIEDALRFYLGFLSAEKSEDYLLQSLSSMLGGTVKDSENRLARMDFKMAVELAKLCHVVAYSHEVDEGDLQKLHAKCVEEVSRINGTVLFEDAYRYQRGRE